MEDIKNVYTSFYEDIKTMISSLPVLILACLFYSVGQSLAAPLFARLGELPHGLLRWMLEMVIMMHFASLMITLFAREHLVPGDLLHWDFQLFYPLTQSYFVVFLVSMVFTLLFARALPITILDLITLLWIIFTAPLFEAVYLGHESSAHVLSSLLEFWRTNWIPLLLYTAVGVVIYVGVFPFLATVDLMSPLGFGVIFLKATLWAFYWMTKGILFRILYFSNPRSRAFHRHFGQDR